MNCYTCGKALTVPKRPRRRGEKSANSTDFQTCVQRRLRDVRTFEGVGSGILGRFAKFDASWGFL